MNFLRRLTWRLGKFFDYPILVSLHAQIKNNSIYEPKVARCLCVFHQVLVSSFGKRCGFQQRQIKRKDDSTPFTANKDIEV